MKKNLGETQKKDTKQRILDAASALINEKGYDEVSIPDICSAAGISKTTFHYYFPQKRDLYYDMEHYFGAAFSDNYYRVFEKSTFTQQIWEFYEIMLDEDLKYGHRFSQQYFINRLKEHEERGFYENLFHRKPMVAVIRSAQAAGQMRNCSDPEAVCMALSYAVRGVILAWAIEDGTLDLKQRAKDVVRTILLPAEGFDLP